MPTVLEITPRRVKGTYAGYSAAAYGNDIYACTDKPVVFIFGHKYNCHSDLVNNSNHRMVREVLFNLSAGGVSITTKGNNGISGNEFNETSKLLIGSNSIKLALNSSNNLYMDVVVDPDSERFFTSGTKGLKISGIQAAINSAKATIDNYTINGKKISTNPGLNSGEINVGSNADWGTPTYISQTNSIGSALHALDRNLKSVFEKTEANGYHLNNVIKILDTSRTSASEANFTAISKSLSDLGTGYKDLISIANTLHTFLEANDTTDTTINRWKEIQTFLAGVTDTQTLTGLLESQKTEIMNTMQPYITKLNGIEAGANKYVLPVTSSSTLGGIRIGFPTGNTDNFALSIDINQKAFTVIRTVNNTANGLMTPALLAKLNGIEEGANNYTYTLPVAAAGVLGGVKIANDKRYLNNFYLRMDNNQVAFVVVDPVSSSLDGLMTKEDKAKLNGIAANANNYSLPTASSTTKGGVKLGYTNNGKNYKVDIDANGNLYVNVPWVDTNTTYSAATTTNNGLMTADMVTKLNGIATGANNYSLPTASDTVKGGMKTGTGHFQRAQGNYGVNIDQNERAYVSLPVVDSTASGLMSTAMLTKLNGIATGANNYSLPTASTTVKGGVKVGGGLSMSGESLETTYPYLRRLVLGDSSTDYVELTADVDRDEIDTQRNIHIPAATTSTAGVMSAADKTKLNGIAANANNYSLPGLLQAVDDYGEVMISLYKSGDKGLAYTYMSGSNGTESEATGIEFDFYTTKEVDALLDTIRASIPNIVEVSSLPANPDSNTLYLVS